MLFQAICCIYDVFCSMRSFHLFFIFLFTLFFIIYCMYPTLGPMVRLYRLTI